MERELKIHQPAMTVDEQIKNLKDLGLVINDEIKARKILNDISYFRLVKAYSLNFKPKNGRYKENVPFEQIVELYLFNANFRQKLFGQIERIEVTLRARIANYLSLKYGVLGYNNSDNFENKKYHDSFISEINQELERNAKTPFVKNFRENYVGGELPLYALVEVFSFGMMSKFFKNLHNEDKKEIAKGFSVEYTYFESWVESVAYVRNICAHYGRLYNAKLAKKPILYKEYRKANIDNYRVFGVLLCMKHLLQNDRGWKIFVEEMDLMFDKYKSVDKFTMGFPVNWKELLEQ